MICNDEIKIIVVRDNCKLGEMPSYLRYTIPAMSVCDGKSKEDANWRAFQMHTIIAQDKVNAEGQCNNGSCTPMPCVLQFDSEGIIVSGTPDSKIKVYNDTNLIMIVETDIAGLATITQNLPNGQYYFTELNKITNQESQRQCVPYTITSYCENND